MTTTEDSTTGTTEDSTPVVTWADRYVPVGDEATDDGTYTVDRLRTEHVALTARVKELVDENAALTANLESAQRRHSDDVTERSLMQEQMDRRLQRAREELEQFKAQVVEVADRYAREYDLCSVIDRALEEVGLERKRLRYRGAVTFTVEFETGLLDRSRGLPDSDWVQGSIRTDEVMDAIRDSFDMDSDHEDTEISGISYRVRNVQEAE